MMTKEERQRALYRTIKHMFFIMVFGIISLFELPGGGTPTVRMLIGNVVALMILGRRFPQGLKDSFQAITEGFI